jgi:hypothetical protein
LHRRLLISPQRMAGQQQTLRCKAAAAATVAASSSKQQAACSMHPQPAQRGLWCRHVTTVPFGGTPGYRQLGRETLQPQRIGARVFLRPLADDEARRCFKPEPGANSPATGDASQKARATLFNPASRTRRRWLWTLDCGLWSLHVRCADFYRAVVGRWGRTRPRHPRPHFRGTRLGSLLILCAGGDSRRSSSHPRDRTPLHPPSASNCISECHGPESCALSWEAAQLHSV